MEHIAKRIEALRVAAGISETQLATNSAISRMTLKRRMIAPGTFTFSELQRIADVFGTTALDLLSDHKASA